MSEPLTTEQEMKYGLSAMSWYGWGSPIGLGIFVVSLSVAALIVRLALHGI